MKARQYRRKVRPISDDQRFVDVIRVAIGLVPLYSAFEKESQSSHGYEYYECLLRLASKDCKRCGGFGYCASDSPGGEMPCPCTGAVRGKGGRGRRVHEAAKAALHVL